MSDYDDPRAHALRAEYHADYGGDELPVLVEHWICQCLEGTTRPIYCRSEEVGVDPEAKALEREANIFAANLVMPEPAVRAAGGQNCFGVSDEALSWRLYNLGLTETPPG